MLVLSRHLNEEIIINDTIRVVVIDIRGDKVRLGIDAPQDVKIARREIWEATKNGGKANVRHHRP